MNELIALPVLAALNLFAGCATHAAWSVAEGQHPHSFHRKVTTTLDGRLLLFLPEGFRASGGTKYPLLIFLHGAGEAGDDLEQLTVQGPPKIVVSQPDFPFIVASPQSPNSSRGLDPGSRRRDSGATTRRDGGLSGARHVLPRHRRPDRRRPEAGAGVCRLGCGAV